MITNLVLSGGANKCLVFVGALQSLEELQLLPHITNYAGTSGGAIITLLLVLGYSVSNIIELYHTLDLHDLLNINSDTILHFFDNYGLDNGDKVVNITKIVIRKKTHNENITFKELYAHTHKHLVITGTCVEKETVEYFDHIHTPDMPVYLAIRISISLPFIFSRVMYNNMTYVDGGLLEYMPIHYFKNITQTLALGIKNNSVHTIDPIHSIDTFIYKLFCALYRVHQDTLLQNFKKQIIIYDIDINGTEKLDITDKLKIIDIGYNETNIFFKDIIIQQTIDRIIESIIQNTINM
jgi:predicted acylesterase/phospholipase RssA